MRPLRSYPTQIALKELPAEGKQYFYTRESGELNESFSDLLSPQQNYSVEIFIKPIGDAFEMTGTLRSSLQVPCALCGLDLPYPVSENIREILVLGEELPRDGHSARVNHVTELEEGPSAQILKTEVFDVAEFLHEILALSTPIRLTRGPDCDAGRCPEIQGAIAMGTLKLETDSPSGSTHKPFDVLKGFKLKS